MLEIMRDLASFGELLSLLKENGVALLETNGLKLVFHEDEEEDKELPTAIGFAVPDTEDEDFVVEDRKREMGFGNIYDKLNVKDMK